MRFKFLTFLMEHKDTKTQSITGMQHASGSTLDFVSLCLCVQLILPEAKLYGKLHGNYMLKIKHKLPRSATTIAPLC